MTTHTRIPVSLPRRRFLKLGAALGGVAAMSSFITVEAVAAGRSKVNMQLGWLASNGIMGEVVAKRMGFYEEEGIELEVTPGGPGVDGVASVAAGRAQVGHLSSSPSLMLARSAGIPIKAFAAGYQKHPFTYFSLESNPIRTPQDMIGKTIATQVEVVKMGSDMNQVMTGQAAAVTGWMTNTNALKVLGDGRVDMMLWDAGIQLYANVYYATDNMLANHADVLARFLTASARGWGEARANPEAGVDHLVAEYRNLSRESELEAVGPVLGFSFNDVTARDGWAAMHPDNWQAQIDTYAQLGQFKGETPTVDDVMSTEILAATESVRKQIG